MMTKRARPIAWLLLAATAGCDSPGTQPAAPVPNAATAVPNIPPAPPALPADDSVIPAAFVGEWNRILRDCGTGMNDSGLRIEPAKMTFYESAGTVKSVKVQDPRTITVAASFSGEGETWDEDVHMVLSESGNDLTIGELTRHRCN